MSIAIQLEHASKRYRTGRSRTLVDLVASNVDRWRGRTREVHSATRGRIDATIHALRDVSFDVPAGAGVGIIGRNGAGKTTLLKLISRVTWPTSGHVRVRRPRGVAHRARRRFSPGAHRARERVPRRRAVRAVPAGDRPPVRRDRPVRRRRAPDRHADEALLVRTVRAARLQRRHSQPARHRAGGRSARGRRRGVPPPGDGGAAGADRRGPDRALHLARHVERPPAVQPDSLDGRRARARARPGRRDRRALHERGEPAGAGQSGHGPAEPSWRHGRSALRVGRAARRAGRRAGSSATGDTLVVRASYRAIRPVERPCSSSPSSTSTPAS
jgi:energy-coupling factor transporter ATP-binding protein EcfA2